jgi:predicted phosphodiesterase
VVADLGFNSMTVIGSGWERAIRGLVIPDVHYPVHDWRAVELMLKAAQEAHKRTPLDFVIQLGDLLDLNALGRWTANAPRAVEGNRIIGDLQLAGADGFLGRLRKMFPETKLFLLEGNHEERIERMLDSQPYLEGLIDLGKLLELDSINCPLIRCDSQKSALRFTWRDGKIVPEVLKRTDWCDTPGVAFVHGWYHNMHSAKKHAETWGRGPILFGHTHTVQQYTSNKFGHPRPFAASMGHLRLEDPSWIKGPHKWQQAFGLLNMGIEDWSWELQMCRISKTEKRKYVCYVDGQRYEQD